jgi:hypothetical protein
MSVCLGWRRHDTQSRWRGYRGSRLYHSPHSELYRADSHTKEVHRSKCFGDAEIGRRETTCTSKAA